MVEKVYSFKQGKDIRVAFDSAGYVVEAKGLQFLLWTDDLAIDKSLIGKHVDELAEMLKKNGTTSAYTNFEIGVHLPMLKAMLSEKSS